MTNLIPDRITLLERLSHNPCIRNHRAGWENYHILVKRGEYHLEGNWCYGDGEGCDSTGVVTALVSALDIDSLLSDALCQGRVDRILPSTNEHSSSKKLRGLGSEKADVENYQGQVRIYLQVTKDILAFKFELSRPNEFGGGWYLP